MSLETEITCNEWYRCDVTKCSGCITYQGNKYIDTKNGKNVERDYGCFIDGEDLE